MKAKTLLVAAVMFFALSAAAFAQATFQVGSIPVTAVTATGQTEGTGAITFSVVSGASATGTISVSYGSNVIITSTLSTAANLPGAPAGVTINTAASSYNPGVVVINVPNTLVVNSTFTLTNVRVAVAGTGLTSLNASLSSVNNAIVAGQTTVTVISSIANGIGSVSSTAAALNGVAPATNNTAVMKVKEGYLNAFSDITYGGIGFPVWVRFTLSAAPPAGVTITFPLLANTDSTGVFQAVDSTGAVLATAPAITSTSTSLAVYYALATNSDPSKVETLSVGSTANPISITIASSATLPLPAATITFTATLAPIGTALDSSNNPITPAAGKAPRFAALEVGPATLMTVSGSSTAVIVPFASTVSASGYNTGLAIANTTTDPGTTALGYTTAVKQGGAITFYFYPQQSGSTAPTAFSYTTSASSPGTGLDATGKVPSGSTYSVLLSQLLAAAQAPADFSGYIIMVCGFTNAHVQYIITDFKAFANGGQGLIINAARTGASEALLH